MSIPIRSFLLLVGIVCYVNAFAIYDISTVSKPENIGKFLYCLYDKDNSMDAKGIIEDYEASALKKSNPGYFWGTYICKAYVKNSGSNKKTVVFYNSRAGMDHLGVDIYGLELLRSFDLGDMRPLKNRSYDSIFSNFELTLNPSEEVVIVFKYQTVGAMELSWMVSDVKNFIINENNNSIYSYLFFGFIIAMIFYKFFIYLSIRDREYLVYTFTLVCIAISQSSTQGVLYYFFNERMDYFSMTVTSWIFYAFFMIFLWYFAYIFFAIGKQSRFYYFFVVIILYNISAALLLLLSYVWVDILKSVPVLIFIATVESMVLFLFSLIMFFMKKPGSGYFLVAHFIYIVSFIGSMSVLFGESELSFFTWHIISFGLFFLLLFMSLALTKKFEIIKKENEAAKEHIEKNRQYTMIGTTIAYISHQWKQPLSVLSSQTSLLLAKIEYEPNEPIISIKDKAISMERVVLHIGNTMENIKALFLDKKMSVKEFDSGAVICKLIENFEEKMKKYGIKVSSKLEDNLVIYGSENLFSHAISNIIQNSIEAFEGKKGEKIIFLSLKELKNSIEIVVKDNAGGIFTTPIESIFDPMVTGKSFGFGVGLAFSKNIIESKFNGSIRVYNQDGGAVFKLELSNSC